MGSRGSHEGHTAHPPPQGRRLRWAKVEHLRGAKRAPCKEVVERETQARRPPPSMPGTWLGPRCPTSLGPQLLNLCPG